MIEDIQAAIPLGILLSFMMGPVFFVLLETSITKGFRAALAFDLGAILADAVFLAIAYFSSFQLLQNLSNQPGLYVFGGVILVIYGLAILFNKANSKKGIVLEKNMKTNYLALFIKGFLLNFINVGVLIFWLGIIIVVGPSLNNDPNRMITFFSTVLLTYLITDIFKILLAKQLKNRLTPVRIALIKRILGIVLIVCGVVLIIKGFLPKGEIDLEQGIKKIEQIHE